jgi:hypothetical protein
MMPLRVLDGLPLISCGTPGHLPECMAITPPGLLPEAVLCGRAVVRSAAWGICQAA